MRQHTKERINNKQLVHREKKKKRLRKHKGSDLSMQKTESNRMD